MSETASIQTNRTVVILLVVVAVLLAAIAGILVASGSSDDVPAPTASGTATPADSTAGQPAGTAAPPTDFDPTTATRVPEGAEPADFVAGYYDAILAGEWEEAFSRQPAHKQTGSVDDFAGQIQGYGVSGYEIVSAGEQGEQYVVVADQQTAQYGTFENQWVFMDFEGEWLVQDKAVTGMK
jgi:hypothetical protein